MEPNDQESQQLQKPRQVKIAVYLLYASIAVSILLRLVYDIRYRSEYMTRPGVIAAMILIPLASIYFANRISAGKNWARFLLLAGFIINLFELPTLISRFAAEPLLSSISSLLWIANLTALILLFQRPSSDWFNSIKGRSKT